MPRTYAQFTDEEKEIYNRCINEGRFPVKVPMYDLIRLYECYYVILDDIDHNRNQTAPTYHLFWFTISKRSNIHPTTPILLKMNLNFARTYIFVKQIELKNKPENAQEINQIRQYIQFDAELLDKFNQAVANTNPVDIASEAISILHEYTQYCMNIRNFA